MNKVLSSAGAMVLQILDRAAASVENPALQTVLMALEMRNAIGAPATWRRIGDDIGFGIGIAHGFAICSIVSLTSGPINRAHVAKKTLG